MAISEILKKALDRNILDEGDYLDIHYYRISDDMGKYKRGTFISGDRIIMNYPSIPRIMRLEEGIKANFKTHFFVEEKVDGYNVRIFKIKGMIVAITRGGFICPFSTDRLKDFASFERFFEDHPDLVIAGEIAGPENPYIEVYPPYIREDVRFFAFDVFKSGEKIPIAPHRRYEILEKYGIPQVRRFGRFSPDDVESIRDIVFDLNREGIEGIILKSVDSTRMVKYTTININISDIEADAWMILEMPGNFYTSRIARIGFALDEFNIPVDDELLKRVGKAFIKGFLKGIEMYRRTGRISHEYRLRFNDDQNLALFLDHIKTVSDSIKIRIKRIYREDGKFVLEFEKVFLKSTSEISQIMKGGGIYD